LVFDHLERGDLERADAQIELHERLARELRSARVLWQAPLLRAMRATMEGRFADAERLTEEACSVADPTRDRGLAGTLVLQRFGRGRAREDHEALDRLRPELAAMWNAAHLAEWIPAMEGAIHARLGRREEAAESLRQAVLGRIPAKADAEGLGMLAETCAAARDRQLAAALYPRVLEIRDVLFSWGVFGMFCEGPYERQLGLLAAVLGRTDDAVHHFEAAAARTRRLGLPPHLARVLYEHAQALSEAGRDRDQVSALLSEARALSVQLGLTDLLRQIDTLPGGSPPPRRPAAVEPEAVPSFVLRREGDFWTVTSDEGPLHLKDSRGLQTLHRLISHPDQEFHATDLAAEGEGWKDAGNAGEHLDREARDSYRARLEDLEEERREAEQFGDPVRARRAQEEIDFLAAELGRAVGLGGRDRKAGSASERARVTVQKRLREAIRKIGAQAPTLGRHLTMTVQTGTFCAYRPAGRYR
jgi:tetratricopeptide (TPR) repeat protein